MTRNIFASLGMVAVAMVLLTASCRKINLATDLGQGLIPEVDKVKTFDTLIDVETYNHLFTAANDTFRSLATDEQFLGRIDHDPIFGKTDARMFFQTRRYSKLQNLPAKRYLDSVVLYLDYLGAYGDSSVPQTLQVSEIAPSFNFKFSTNRDSAYSIRFNEFPLGGTLATKTVVPYGLKDSILIWPDTVKTAKILSIRLNDDFGRRLLALDSAAMVNDTLFAQHFNGFAIQSLGGNALMGFNLLGAKTRLGLFYRYDNLTTANDQDTTVANFTLVNSRAASSNFVGRDYTGAPVAAVADDNVADASVYIQNTPGIYALIKIPGLAQLPNCVIHLAELQMKSEYDVSDTLFKAPNLFLDAWADGKNFAIPFALSDYIDNSGQLTASALPLFGSMSVDSTDAMGNTIKYWQFNLTRYLQNVVNGRKPSYDLRLYAKSTFAINDTLELGGAKRSLALGIPLNYETTSSGASLPVPAIGRVRLAGGAHPTQKMKLRIVYSKL